MGKLFSWVVLAFFVAIVPFVSWYYLKQGLDYRKNALAQLVVKDSISLQQDSLRLLTKKTTLLVLHSNKSIHSNLAAINEQFTKTEGFQILTLDSIPLFIKLPVGYCKELISKYQSKDYLLIDIKSRIRNSYNNDSEDIKKLVEHLAIVLPRLKESDIKMKK